MGREFTELEEQQALEEHDRKQQMLLKKGKIIVLTIAILEICVTIINVFIKFNIFSFIIEISLSIALILGVRWVRYLFAIGAAMSCMLSIYMLLVGLQEILLYTAIDPGVIIALYLFKMIYSLVSCILLFKSKAVTEYLYVAKNG